MKLKKAIEKIEKSEKHINLGFRVHFETFEGYKYAGDYFPERDEPMFKTATEAWKMAEKFAKASKLHLNVYVIDEHYKPVRNYKEQMYNKTNS